MTEEQQYQRKYRIANRERLRACSREYRLINLEQLQAKKKEYRARHREEINRKQRERRLENPEQDRKDNWKWRLENPERLREIRRRYRVKNRETLSYKCAERRKKDPMFRLTGVLRSRIRIALKNCKKSAKSEVLVGCSFLELKRWLESLFQDGMSWENYGPVWHVDHIQPCASFDLSDPEQQKQCFHYTNLQPLFALDNFKKGSRV